MTDDSPNNSNSQRSDPNSANEPGTAQAASNTNETVECTLNSTTDAQRVGIEELAKQFKAEWDKATDFEKDWRDQIKARNDAKKKKRKPNALRHGIYSQDVVLPWESEDDFEALLKDLKQDWRPRGSSEEEAVLNLAYWKWMWRRAVKVPQLAFHRHPFGIWPPAGQMSWLEMVDAQHKVAEFTEDGVASASFFLKSLSAILTGIFSGQPDSSVSSDKKMQELMHRLTGELETMKTLVEKSIVPALERSDGVIKRYSKLFDGAYDPDLMDRQVGTVAAIETQIDKAQARIVRLKEYHALEVSRSASLPPTVSPPIIPAHPVGREMHSVEEPATQKKGRGR